jgi:hypothetical protein
MVAMRGMMVSLNGDHLLHVRIEGQRPVEILG